MTEHLPEVASALISPSMTEVPLEAVEACSSTEGDLRQVGLVPPSIVRDLPSMTGDLWQVEVACPSIVGDLLQVELA